MLPITAIERLRTGKHIKAAACEDYRVKSLVEAWT